MRLKLVSIFLVLAVILVGCGAGEESLPTGKVSNVKTAAAVAVAETVVDPQNGWWWNPAEGGSGYAIERQRDKIFLSAFLYETNGFATWYVSTLTRQVDGTFAGLLLRYSGGQSLLGAYKPAAGTTTPANVVLTFSTSAAGTLSIQPTDASTPRLISIERFPISSPAFSVSNGSFESGWWWNESEGGRGFFIEVQGSTAFIGSFMYDNAGQPVWYASTASLQGAQILNGSLLQYANGQSLTGTYKPATPIGTTIGNMAFNFTSANTANMVLPNGVVVPVKRFMFNPISVNRWVEVASLQGTANLSNGGSAILAQLDGSSIAVYSGATWDPLKQEFSCLPVEYKAVRIASGNKLSEVTFAGPIGFISPGGTAVGDFDGNGELDVFFGHLGCDRSPYPGEHNSILFSRGGILSDGSSVLPPINAFTHSSDAADVRGIGVADIMVTNNGNFGCNLTLPSYVTNPRLSFTINCLLTVGPYLLRNNRDGTFTYDATSLPDLVANPPTWPSPNDDWLFNSTLLADVTGDGMPDLVLGTFGVSSSAGVMYPNDGLGGFRTTVVRMPTPLFGAGVTSVVKMRLWTFANRRVLILSSVADAYKRSGLQFLEFTAGTFKDVTAEMMPGYANKFWIQDIQVVDLDLDGCPDLVLDAAGPDLADVNVWFCRNGKFVAGPQPAAHMVLKPVFVDGRPKLLSIQAPLGGKPPLINTNVRLYDLQ